MARHSSPSPATVAHLKASKQPNAHAICGFDGSGYRARDRTKVALPSFPTTRAAVEIDHVLRHMPLQGAEVATTLAVNVSLT